jgi:hypothetical protein
MEFKSVQTSSIASSRPESAHVERPAAIVGSHGKTLANLQDVTFSPLDGRDGFSQRAAIQLTRKPDNGASPVPARHAQAEGMLMESVQQQPGDAVHASKTIARCNESLATIRSTVEKWERQHRVDPAMRKQIAVAEQAILGAKKKAEASLRQAATTGR